MRRVVLLLALAALPAATVQAGAAFFRYEVMVDGRSKDCVYEYLGSRYVIRIPATRMCPPRIEVD